MDNNRARAHRFRYAALVLVPVIIVVLACWYICWGPPTTVVLVRHADRQGEELSPAGEERAEELAHVLEKSAISAIYTSEVPRTQATAEPTATALGLVPVVIPVAEVEALADDIRDNHSGEKVLVVGHSHTVPEIIAEFGGPAVTIPGNEYDNLYVLTLCRCRRNGPRLTNLQYGATSP